MSNPITVITEWDEEAEEWVTVFPDACNPLGPRQ